MYYPAGGADLPCLVEPSRTGPNTASAAASNRPAGRSSTSTRSGRASSEIRRGAVGLAVPRLQRNLPVRGYRRPSKARARCSRCTPSRSPWSRGPIARHHRLPGPCRGNAASTSGNPGSGQRGTMEIVMDALGWTLDDFAVASELRRPEQAAGPSLRQQHRRDDLTPWVTSSGRDPGGDDGLRHGSGECHRP